jgi:O-methyltransferase
MGVKKLMIQYLETKGFTITKNVEKKEVSILDITEQEFWDLHKICQPYTMTSVERLYALYKAVDYVLKNNIEGDFVEAGVWRGGCALLMAKMLANRGITNRKIFMYDTYEGMSEPQAIDEDLLSNKADVLLEKQLDNKEGSDSVWCLASLEDVQNNFTKEGVTLQNINFVKGKVEDTIPHTIPTGSIALLRLDTDWYESTKHELQHLYPKLSKNGVLLIDDYGHWKGCRQAVDEYFAANNINLYMNRVDYTCRSFIKTN